MLPEKWKKLNWENFCSLNKATKQSFALHITDQKCCHEMHFKNSNRIKTFSAGTPIGEPRAPPSDSLARFGEGNKVSNGRKREEKGRKGERKGRKRRG